MQESGYVTRERCRTVAASLLRLRAALVGSSVTSRVPSCAGAMLLTVRHNPRCRARHRCGATAARISGLDQAFPVLGAPPRRRWRAMPGHPIWVRASRAPTRFKSLTI